DLNASIDITNQQQRATILASFRTLPYTAQIQSDSAEVQADVSLSLDSAGLNLQATGSWQTNRFQSEAHFGRTGALPETARLKVANFRIPAAAVRLPQYNHI